MKLTTFEKIFVPLSIASIIGLALLTHPSPIQYPKGTRLAITLIMDVAFAILTIYYIFQSKSVLHVILFLSFLLIPIRDIAGALHFPAKNLIYLLSLIFYPFLGIILLQTAFKYYQTKGWHTIFNFGIGTFLITRVIFSLSEKGSFLLILAGWLSYPILAGVLTMKLCRIVLVKEESRALTLVGFTSFMYVFYHIMKELIELWWK